MEKEEPWVISLYINSTGEKEFILTKNFLNHIEIKELSKKQQEKIFDYVIKNYPINILGTYVTKNIVSRNNNEKIKCFPNVTKEIYEKLLK
jgi:hypothetical protein